MNNILIVGLGNIGNRYLEGVLSVKDVHEIHIIEKDKNLIQDLSKRYRKEICSKQIFLTSSIEKLTLRKFLITIVSTTATDRYKILLNIKSNVDTSYYIIEKVLAQSEEQLESIKNLFYNHTNVWISSPRRSMIWYKEIKKKIFKEKKLSFLVKGYNWGLACNAIHFIDLVNWITGEKIISIQTNRLNSYWTKAKRDGFLEITGGLKIKFTNDVSLMMRCDKDNSNMKNYNIFIKNQNIHLGINEQRSLAKFNNEEKIDGIFSNLSDVVPEVITSLINFGSCEWTNLNESIFSHQKLIQSLVMHWKKNKASKFDILPIT